MLKPQRPQTARRAARLAVACLLFAFIAAVIAPAATGVFASGLRTPTGEPTSTTASAGGASVVHDLDAHLDGFELVSSRSLLQLFRFPPCLWGCRIRTRIWGWWFGFCRYNGRLYRCYRPIWWRFWPWWPFRTSTSSLSLAGAADSSESARVASAPAQSSSSAAPSASSRSSFRQDLSASAPYAACSDDSDCRQLSASGFAEVDGATPAAVNGKLFATCRRPSFVNDQSGVFDDFPGICMCKFISRNAPPGTLERVTGQPVPGGGGSGGGGYNPYWPPGDFPYGPGGDPYGPGGELPYYPGEDPPYVPGGEDPPYVPGGDLPTPYGLGGYSYESGSDNIYGSGGYDSDNAGSDDAYGSGGYDGYDFYGGFQRRLQNFEQYVKDDYCTQSTGARASSFGGSAGQSQEAPFFVPGQPPVSETSAVASAAPAGGEPSEADIETSEASISSGSIVGQAFVDGLPGGVGLAA